MQSFHDLCLLNSMTDSPQPTPPVAIARRSKTPLPLVADRPSIPPAPLGQLLLRKSVISLAQLEAALLEQNYTQNRLGDCLLKLGYLTADQLQAALTNQTMPLGEILLDHGWITPDQLQAMLAEQETYYAPLGELCFHQKLISYHQLADALNEQHWRRNGFWVLL